MGWGALCIAAVASCTSTLDPTEAERLLVARLGPKARAAFNLGAGAASDEEFFLAGERADACANELAKLQILVSSTCSGEGAARRCGGKLYKSKHQQSAACAGADTCVILFDAETFKVNVDSVVTEGARATVSYSADSQLGAQWTNVEHCPKPKLQDLGGQKSGQARFVRNDAGVWTIEALNP